MAVKRKQTRERMVLIEWNDSASQDNWAFRDELEKRTPIIVRSVGWMIEDRKDFKVIVQNATKACRSGSCSMTIPTAAIRGRIKTLAVWTKKAAPKKKKKK